MMEEMIVEKYVKDFQSACCPLGYMDIDAAVRHAIAIGEDGDWLFELVQEQAEEIGLPFGKMDIVYTVLDHILQMARNEIDDKTNFDFLNDGVGKVYTYGNYCDSRYDAYDELVDELTNLFNKEGVSQEDLTQVTLYFLEQIEFDWTKVSPYKNI